MPYRKLQTTELVRICLASADADAWAEFVRRFQPTIAAVVLRTTRRWGESSPLVVEDLVQETFVKLCAGEGRLLRQFQPRHPKAIFGYMKLITTRVVHDYFRQMHTAKRGALQVVPAVDNPEAGPTDSTATERVERGVLLGEIERRLSQIDLGPYAERDRRIFWLYYRCGMTAQAIAALLQGQLTTAGVESAISRATRLIREELAGDGYGTVEPEASVEGLPAQKGNGAK
jgi:RNA polymerase sigma-70 factor, ECF subfamily